MFGIPLVDVAFGGPADHPEQRGVAKGWIALGDVACGVLLSGGGIAVGGIAIGGVAVGVLSLGGVALGAFALGGLALAYSGVGGVAFAAQSAFGGVAAAGQFAAGGVAIAPHANDLAAQEHFETCFLTPFVQHVGVQGPWLLGASILAACFLALAQRRRSRAQGS